MQLSEVSEIRVGYQARTRIQEQSDGTHWLIQAKDLNGNQYIDKKLLIKFTPERKPGSYLVKKDDILFKARGVDHPALCLEENLEDTLAASTFYIIRTKNDGLLPRYLAWWLSQPYAQSCFASISHGRAMSFIPISSISKLTFIIPPLSFQKKVVETAKLWEREQLLIKKIADQRSLLIKAAYTKANQKIRRES